MRVIRGRLAGFGALSDGVAPVCGFAAGSAVVTGSFVVVSGIYVLRDSGS